MSLFVDCGRKQEFPERTHTCMDEAVTFSPWCVALQECLCVVFLLFSRCVLFPLWCIEGWLLQLQQPQPYKSADKHHSMLGLESFSLYIPRHVQNTSKSKRRVWFLPYNSPFKFRIEIILKNLDNLSDIGLRLVSFSSNELGPWNGKSWTQQILSFFKLDCRKNGHHFRNFSNSV